MKNQIVSLYDYTGESLRPWAKMGYECFAYDIQNPKRIEPYPWNGVSYRYADLYDMGTLLRLFEQHNNKVVFMSAFPPCTDLSAAGARWWKDKAKIDPAFQINAAKHVKTAALMGMAWHVPFYIENPIGALTRLWRKPDHKFDPYEYGGYLPTDDAHPDWPQYIPPRDAYRKRTCLWTGGSFRMPTKRPVDYVNLTYKRTDPTKGQNFNPQTGKLGGKSLRTKNIRSATPRGFARAVCEANAA